MPRVPLLARSTAPADCKAVFERLESERRMPTPDIFRALANAPEQLNGLLTYSSSLRSADELGKRYRELAILAVAHQLGGEYIVAHHLADAVRAGLTPEQVAAVPQAEETSDTFEEADLAVMRLARLIANPGTELDGAWALAARHLTDRQLVQLTLTTSWYVTGVLIEHALGLNLEPEYT